MIDHLGIQCADVPAALEFYRTVFAPIGLDVRVQFPAGAGSDQLVVGMGTDEKSMDFWLSPNTAGEARENHIAFAATDRAAVDAVHRAALATGAEVLNAPREWPEYHPGYYAVFLRDPDGNNVEAVTHH